jgi:exosortase K
MPHRNSATKATLFKGLMLLTLLGAGKYSLRAMKPEYVKGILGYFAQILEATLGIPFHWVAGSGFRNDALHVVIDHSCVGSGFFMLLVALGLWHLPLGNFRRALLISPLLLLVAACTTLVVNSVRLVVVFFFFTRFPFWETRLEILHIATGVFLFATSLIAYHALLIHLFKKSPA